MEIITANTSHIPLIRNLTMQVWPQTYIPIVGEAQVDYMLDRFYTPDALLSQMTKLQHSFIIGYSDGVPVAFASYSEIEPAVYKLHKLYIVIAMQGKGIGRAMADHIVASVKKLGGSSLRLNVNIHNHPAMAFYNKYGFRHLLDEDIDIGSGYYMNDHVLQMDV
ncbi:MAG: GNAT family N-acetyltransferase [Taibaiella sp.]|nr:GNAT family N-acetyltransferase [Taibaiella sp.]